MSTANIQPDQEWGRLIDLSPGDRESRMVQRYRAVAGLPDAERDQQLLGMVQAEYALADDKLRDFTRSRLKAWQALEEQVAHRIVKSYDAAMLKMPGKDAMRHVAVVQTVAREMSVEDVKRLGALIPAILAGIPVITGFNRAEPSASQQVAAPPAKKGMWPFGKR